MTMMYPDIVIVPWNGNPIDVGGSLWFANNIGVCCWLKPTRRDKADFLEWGWSHLLTQLIVMEYQFFPAGTLSGMSYR